MVHTTPIHVRFRDIDAMRHVNNAVYLSYTEEARIKLFNDVLPNINWEETGFILARAEIDYIKPIVLGDEIVVETTCSRMGTKSLDLSYHYLKLKDGARTLMAKSLTVLVGFSYSTHKAIEIPEDWKTQLLRFKPAQEPVA